MMASYSNALDAIVVAYMGVDYLREVVPELHKILRPLIWGFFTIAIIARLPYYKYWNQELQSFGIFVGSLLFMLGCFCIEVIAMHYVTTVLGLDWHW